MNSIDDFGMGDADELIEGYMEMSRETAREPAAKEWSEALIGDPSPLS